MIELKILLQPKPVVRGNRNLLNYINKQLRLLTFTHALDDI